MNVGSKRLVILVVTAILACAMLVAILPGAAADPVVTDTIAVGTSPRGICVNPDTDRVYVANEGSDNISVIDGVTDLVTATIPVGAVPIGVCVNPDTNRIYVANNGDNTVSVIAGATGTVTATIPVGVAPEGIGVNPVTNMIYTANSTAGTVSVIDGDTDAVTATITVGSIPREIGVNPVTNVIYAANNTDGTVSVIDGDTNAVTATVAVGGSPNGIGVNPVTNLVYVANYADDTVSVIDGATDTVTDTILEGSGPAAVGVDQAANKVYVANWNSGDASVIDGNTGIVTDTFEVGTTPWGVAVNPDAYTVYMANYGSNDVSVIYNPPLTWYLAEGCTEGGFETWVLVQNPNPGPVSVDLGFMTSTGYQAGPQDVVIPAASRQSFNVNDYVTDWNVSTRVDSDSGEIICERAMYGGNRTWAHDSIGVTEPSDTWYLAEGCTAGDFETWVLVQNPNAVPVSVDLGFMTSTGYQAGPQDVAIPANSRQSFKANDYVTDYNVSTQVDSTGGAGVICERAMYGGDRTWAHDSIGAPEIPVTNKPTNVIPVGVIPMNLAVNPATNLVYVPDYGDDTVSVIDGDTNAVTTTIPVGASPATAAANPATNTIYVTNEGDDTVSVIDGATNTETTTVAVGDRPWGIGVNTSTNRAYVASFTEAKVFVIDGATNTVIDTIAVGVDPSAVAVNPTTNLIYVANSTDGTVSVINGATNLVTGTITVGGMPFGVCVNPATNTVYTANEAADTVSVIEGASGTVTATIPVGDAPYGLGFNINTNQVYLTNSEDNTMSVIDGATNTVTDTVGVGLTPQGVCVNPATNRIYVADSNQQNVMVINVVSFWYLAEGCTAGDFETWVLVQNPNPGPVTVDLTFMTSTGYLAGPQDVPIPANSRHSFNLGEYVSDWDVSTLVYSSGGAVICERAMYGGGRTWAHDSIGVTEPSAAWYLAEGCTGGDFETWVLVQNPGAAAVTVDLTFMTSTGPVAGPQGVTVPTNSRVSFRVNDFVTDYDVSTRVRSTDGAVICERAVYGGGRAWAHDSIGYGLR